MSNDARGLHKMRFERCPVDMETWWPLGTHCDGLVDEGLLAGAIGSVASVCVCCLPLPARLGFPGRANHPGWREPEPHQGF